MSAPKLRFPEFKGEWEERRLGEFMTFRNGVNADKSMYGHGRKFINVMDIIAGQPIISENIIGSVSVSDGVFGKNEVLYGDILFQRSSEIREETGQSNIYVDKDISATFGGFVIRGRPIAGFDPHYFDALLKTDKARKDITSRSGGSTRFNVGQEALGAVQVDVAPYLPEQKKIAAFLGVVDDKIAALKDRQAGLERYKRGLMQALFSQRLRFTKPDGTPFPDWEEKRLGEIAEFSKGKGIAKADVVENGATKCIRYGELYTMYREVISTIVSKTNIDRSDLVLSQIGDVIIPASGEDRLDMAKASCVKAVGVALGGDLNILRGDFNGEFIAYYLSNHKRRDIARFAQGNSVVHLYGTQLKIMDVEIPHPEEQQKIADALSAMDAKIQAVADQVAQMETFKKGLLQQMFV